MNCPKCCASCECDEVDVGAKIIYGPWSCLECGWSEEEYYDSSNGIPKAQKYSNTPHPYGGGDCDH
jgi:hypothetical protein